MSNLALLPPTAHCAVADRVEPYGLVAGPPHGACRALALDARGRHVAAGYERGALFVWDLSVRDAAPARAAVSAHLDGVHAVAWLSPSHLATSGGDGALTVWRLDVTRGTLRASARAAFACASLDVYERSLLAVAPGAPPRVFACRLDDADESDGEFEAGDRVQARFEGGPIYYVGTIESVNPYAVAYDDGDHETSVDASLIRSSRLPDAPKLPQPDGARQACSTNLEGLDVGAVCDAACFVGDRVFAAKGEECWCGDLRLRLHGKVASVAYASRHVACVCADGAVRILKIDADLTLLHSLRNPVDKVKFSCPSFGAGGEHLVAAAHAGSQVQFYVWEVQSGHCLAQPYDDDKASQDRGPIRALSCFSGGALICTAASNAFQHAVRVWAAPDGFSWRAYAPNFEEVHENVAYAEREDEFDLVDEPPRRAHAYVQPELRVDVGSRPSLFDEASSSDDEPRPVTFDEPAAPVSAAPLPSPLRVKQASPRRRPAPRRSPSPSPSTSPSPPTLAFDQTCEMCRREKDGRKGRVAHSVTCPRAQGQTGKGRPKQPQTKAKAPAPVVKALPPPVVLPPEVELVVSPAQALAETRRAEADGWRVEGSEYLGRTVRRTILDAAGRPVSCSDGMIRGWLDAARSDYVDGTGTPAALWHVYLATGALAGDEVDLELYEVADSIVERPVEFKYVYPSKRAGGSWSTCVHVNKPDGGTTATSAGSHKTQAAAARAVDALLLANNKRAVNFPREEELTRAVFSEITATGRTSPRCGQKKTPARLSVVTPAPPDTRGDEALAQCLTRDAPPPPDHRAETTYDDDSGDDWAAKQQKKAPKKAPSAKSPPKRTRCGVCEGCTAGDCGKCKYCKDKPSRGGPNTLRRPCVACRCHQLHAGSTSTVVPPPAPPSPALPPKKKASPLDPRKRAKTQPSVAEAALARAEAVWAGSSTPAARPASLPAPVQGSALKSAQASALALSSARVGRPASQADMAKVAAAVARAQPPAPSPPPPPTPPPTPPPPVYFDVYTADGGTKLFGRVDLSGAEKLTFGRDAPHVDVPLEHASASRHHATIRFEGDVAYLADMKSSHRTYVTPPGGTEERITTARLRDGSIVRFGESTRRYVLRRSEPGFSSPPRSGDATHNRLSEIAAKPFSSARGDKRQPPIPKKTDAGKKARRSGVRPESLAALPPPSRAAPPADRDRPGESSRGDDRRGDDRRGDWRGQAPHQDGRRSPPPGSSAGFGELLSDRAARFGPPPGPPRFEARLADRTARFGPPPGPPRNGLSNGAPRSVQRAPWGLSRGGGGSFADVRRDQVDGFQVPRPAPPRRSRSRSRERRRR